MEGLRGARAWRSDCEDFFHIIKLSFMCISFVPGEINISVSSTKFMTKA